MSKIFSEFYKINKIKINEDTYKKYLLLSKKGNSINMLEFKQIAEQINQSFKDNPEAELVVLRDILKQ